MSERIAEQEKQHRQERIQAGLHPLGVRGILKQPWGSRPKSSEPRRALNPRVAAKNKWRRVEALLQNREFLKAYQAARAALQAGAEGVLFPPGTYWLRLFAKVSCEPEPPPAALC